MGAQVSTSASPVPLDAILFGSGPSSSSSYSCDGPLVDAASAVPHPSAGHRSETCDTPPPFPTQPQKNGVTSAGDGLERRPRLVSSPSSVPFSSPTSVEEKDGLAGPAPAYSPSHSAPTLATTTTTTTTTTRHVGFHLTEATTPDLLHAAGEQEEEEPDEEVEDLDSRGDGTGLSHTHQSRSTLKKKNELPASSPPLKNAKDGKAEGDEDEGHSDKTSAGTKNPKRRLSDGKQNTSAVRRSSTTNPINRGSPQHHSHRGAGRTTRSTGIGVGGAAVASLENDEVLSPLSSCGSTLSSSPPLQSPLALHHTGAGSSHAAATGAVSSSSSLAKNTATTTPRHHSQNHSYAASSGSASASGLTPLTPNTMFSFTAVDHSVHAFRLKLSSSCSSSTGSASASYHPHTFSRGYSGGGSGGPSSTSTPTAGAGASTTASASPLPQQPHQHHHYHYPHHPSHSNALAATTTNTAVTPRSSPLLAATTTSTATNASHPTTAPHGMPSSTGPGTHTGMGCSTTSTLLEAQRSPPMGSSYSAAGAKMMAGAASSLTPRSPANASGSSSCMLPASTAATSSSKDTTATTTTPTTITTSTTNHNNSPVSALVGASTGMMTRIHGGGSSALASTQYCFQQIIREAGISAAVAGTLECEPVSLALPELLLQPSEVYIVLHIHRAEATTACGSTTSTAVATPTTTTTTTTTTPTTTNASNKGTIGMSGKTVTHSSAFPSGSPRWEDRHSGTSNAASKVNANQAKKKAATPTTTTSMMMITTTSSGGMARQSSGPPASSTSAVTPRSTPRRSSGGNVNLTTVTPRPLSSTSAREAGTTVAAAHTTSIGTVGVPSWAVVLAEVCTPRGLSSAFASDWGKPIVMPCYSPRAGFGAMSNGGAAPPMSKTSGRTPLTTPSSSSAELSLDSGKKKKPLRQTGSSASPSPVNAAGTSSSRTSPQHHGATDLKSYPPDPRHHKAAGAETTILPLDPSRQKSNSPECDLMNGTMRPSSRHRRASRSSSYSSSSSDSSSFTPSPSSPTPTPNNPTLIPSCPDNNTASHSGHRGDTGARQHQGAEEAAERDRSTGGELLVPDPDQREDSPLPKPQMGNVHPEAIIPQAETREDDHHNDDDDDDDKDLLLLSNTSSTAALGHEDGERRLSNVAVGATVECSPSPTYRSYSGSTAVPSPSKPHHHHHHQVPPHTERGSEEGGANSIFIPALPILPPFDISPSRTNSPSAGAAAAASDARPSSAGPRLSSSTTPRTHEDHLLANADEVGAAGAASAGRAPSTAHQTREWSSSSLHLDHHHPPLLPHDQTNSGTPSGAPSYVPTAAPRTSTAGDSTGLQRRYGSGGERNPQKSGAGGRSNESSRAGGAAATGARHSGSYRPSTANAATIRGHSMPNSTTASIRGSTGGGSGSLGAGASGMEPSRRSVSSSTCGGRGSSVPSWIASANTPRQHTTTLPSTVAPGNEWTTSTMTTSTTTTTTTTTMTNTAMNLTTTTMTSTAAASTTIHHSKANGAEHFHYSIHILSGHKATPLLSAAGVIVGEHLDAALQADHALRYRLFVPSYPVTLGEVTEIASMNHPLLMHPQQPYGAPFSSSSVASPSVPTSPLTTVGGGGASHRPPSHSSSSSRRQQSTTTLTPRRASTSLSPRVGRTVTPPPAPTPTTPPPIFMTPAAAATVFASYLIPYHKDEAGGTPRHQHQHQQQQQQLRSSHQHHYSPSSSSSAPAGGAAFPLEHREAEEEAQLVNTFWASHPTLRGARLGLIVPVVPAAKRSRRALTPTSSSGPSSGGISQKKKAMASVKPVSPRLQKTPPTPIQKSPAGVNTNPRKSSTNNARTNNVLDTVSRGSKPNAIWRILSLNRTGGAAMLDPRYHPRPPSTPRHPHGISPAATPMAHRGGAVASPPFTPGTGSAGGHTIHSTSLTASAKSAARGVPSSISTTSLNTSLMVASNVTTPTVATPTIGASLAAIIAAGTGNSSTTNNNNNNISIPSTALNLPFPPNGLHQGGGSGQSGGLNSGTGSGGGSGGSGGYHTHWSLPSPTGFVGNNLYSPLPSSGAGAGAGGAVGTVSSNTTVGSSYHTRPLSRPGSMNSTPRWNLTAGGSASPHHYAGASTSSAGNFTVTGVSTGAGGGSSAPGGAAAAATATGSSTTTTGSRAALLGSARSSTYSPRVLSTSSTGLGSSGAAARGPGMPRRRLTTHHVTGPAALSPTTGPDGRSELEQLAETYPVGAVSGSGHRTHNGSSHKGSSLSGSAAGEERRRESSESRRSGKKKSSDKASTKGQLAARKTTTATTTTKAASPSSSPRYPAAGDHPRPLQTPRKASSATPRQSGSSLLSPHISSSSSSTAAAAAGAKPAKKKPTTSSSAVGTTSASSPSSSGANVTRDNNNNTTTNKKVTLSKQTTSKKANAVLRKTSAATVTSLAATSPMRSPRVSAVGEEEENPLHAQDAKWGSTDEGVSLCRDPSINSTHSESDEIWMTVNRIQRLKNSAPEVTEVLPWLFVGGEKAAEDEGQLLLKGITGVVNTVAFCVDSFFPDSFEYLSLCLHDRPDQVIFPLFPMVNRFIERHRVQGGKVFVHCNQGVSRSCSFVIAYIMWFKGWCYDRCYEWVRARRTVCSPNAGFYVTLQLWELELRRGLAARSRAFALTPFDRLFPAPQVFRLAAQFFHTAAEKSSEQAVDPDSATVLHGPYLQQVIMESTAEERDGAVCQLDPRLPYGFLLYHAPSGAYRSYLLPPSLVPAPAEDGRDCGPMSATKMVGTSMKKGGGVCRSEWEEKVEAWKAAWESHLAYSMFMQADDTICPTEVPHDGEEGLVRERGRGGKGTDGGVPSSPRATTTHMATGETTTGLYASSYNCTNDRGETITYTCELAALEGCYARYGYGHAAEAVREEEKAPKGTKEITHKSASSKKALYKPLHRPSTDEDAVPPVTIVLQSVSELQEVLAATLFDEAKAPHTSDKDVSRSECPVRTPQALDSRWDRVIPDAGDGGSTGWYPVTITDENEEDGRHHTSNDMGMTVREPTLLHAVERQPENGWAVVQRYEAKMRIDASPEAEAIRRHNREEKLRELSLTSSRSSKHYSHSKRGGTSGSLGSSGDHRAFMGSPPATSGSVAVSSPHPPAGTSGPHDRRGGVRGSKKNKEPSDDAPYDTTPTIPSSSSLGVSKNASSNIPSRHGGTAASTSLGHRANPSPSASSSASLLLLASATPVELPPLNLPLAPADDFPPSNASPHAPTTTVSCSSGGGGSRSTDSRSGGQRVIVAAGESRRTSSGGKTATTPRSGAAGSASAKGHLHTHTRTTPPNDKTMATAGASGPASPPAPHSASLSLSLSLSPTKPGTTTTTTAAAKSSGSSPSGGAAFRRHSQVQSDPCSYSAGRTPITPHSGARQPPTPKTPTPPPSRPRSRREDGWEDPADGVALSSLHELPPPLPSSGHDASSSDRRYRRPYHRKKSLEEEEEEEGFPETYRDKDRDDGDTEVAAGDFHEREEDDEYEEEDDEAPFHIMKPLQPSCTALQTSLGIHSLNLSSSSTPGGTTTTIAPPSSLTMPSAAPSMGMPSLSIAGMPSLLSSEGGPYRVGGSEFLGRRTASETLAPPSAPIPPSTTLAPRPAAAVMTAEHAVEEEEAMVVDADDEERTGEEKRDPAQDEEEEEVEEEDDAEEETCEEEDENGMEEDEEDEVPQERSDVTVLPFPWSQCTRPMENFFDLDDLESDACYAIFVPFGDPRWFLWRGRRFRVTSNSTPTASSPDDGTISDAELLALFRQFAIGAASNAAPREENNAAVALKDDKGDGGEGCMDRSYHSLLVSISRSALRAAFSSRHHAPEVVMEGDEPDDLLLAMD